MKQSRLPRFLVLLTLIPNLAVPVINYQFNVAMDMRFPNEAAMIKKRNMDDFIMVLFRIVFAQ